MVLGHCHNCDMKFSENDVIGNSIKLHHNYPVVLCPRCGAVTWLGSDVQIAFTKTMNRLLNGDFPEEPEDEETFDALE